MEFVTASSSFNNVFMNLSSENVDDVIHIHGDGFRPFPLLTVGGRNTPTKERKKTVS